MQHSVPHAWTLIIDYLAELKKNKMRGGFCDLEWLHLRWLWYYLVYMYVAQIFTSKAHSKKAKKGLKLPYWSLIFLLTNLTRFLQTTLKIVRLIQIKQKIKQTYIRPNKKI